MTRARTRARPRRHSLTHARTNARTHAHKLNLLVISEYLLSGPRQ